MTLKQYEILHGMAIKYQCSQFRAMLYELNLDLACETTVAVFCHRNEKKSLVLLNVFNFGSNFVNK